MSGIRAHSPSYLSLYRQTAGARSLRQKARARVHVKVKGMREAPTIIVHNHLPPVRCNAHRKSLKKDKAEGAPKAPMEPTTGFRGWVCWGRKYARQAAILAAQALVLASTLMPRISVGIGINPIWPESWPSYFRRR